jgi:hypothetical protein
MVLDGIECKECGHVGYAYYSENPWLFRYRFLGLFILIFAKALEITAIKVFEFPFFRFWVFKYPSRPSERPRTWPKICPSCYSRNIEGYDNEIPMESKNVLDAVISREISSERFAGKIGIIIAITVVIAMVSFVLYCIFTGNLSLYNKISSMPF